MALTDGIFTDKSPRLWGSGLDKKIPPPTPEGHEGRLFPPEQSFKSELGITELTPACKKIFLTQVEKKLQAALPSLREARRPLRNRLSLSGDGEFFQARNPTFSPERCLHPHPAAGIPDE